MGVYTVSWGYVPASVVTTVQCPRCCERVVGRYSVDKTKIELPAHGLTVDLECAGGWYKLQTRTNHA